MTAGLDEWPFAFAECPPDWHVREERLQVRLGVNHFRLPPDYRDWRPDDQYVNQHIPFVRFPSWHYCPMRGAMEKLPLFGTRSSCPCRSNLDCRTTARNRRSWMIPSRFIAACPKGHVEDFPFFEWVHKGKNWDERHKLRQLHGRSSASLAGIRIECECGERATMGGSFNHGSLHGIGIDCSGHMPWLGDVEGSPGDCGEQLRVVQRGASNVYFPLTISSIYLPLWGEDQDRKTVKLLENPKIWDRLTSGLDEGNLIQQERCDSVALFTDGIDPVELRETAQKKLDGTLDDRTSRPRSEEEFRRQEYEAMKSGRGGESTDLMVDLRPNLDFGEALTHVLRVVGLVRKLRETRVFYGFSRLIPLDNAARDDVLPLAKDEDINWLPASVVRGEGIFLEFAADPMESWTSRSPVIRRIRDLNESYNDRRRERELGGTEVSPKFVLLHSIAHALITQLSFECGYGSAALRERIYCDQDDSTRPMQGILIYTASGDSEGTLGGLVRQGEQDRLKAVFERAIHRVAWCSSDPICIESTGQGTDNANLAACHGCVLLPETSCEKGNRLLDRALLVGTPESMDIGFLSERTVSS